MEPGGEAFATYYEDWYGQNYADQRYYNSIGGRFLTPDPGGARAADPTDPNSWNMYAYAGGDPVNFNDPTGLVSVPTSPTGGSATSCLNTQFTTWLESHGYTFIPGENLGDFFNTQTGVLGLTLFFEDTQGSSTLYTDMAQVMLNIFQLQGSNPALDSSLHLATGSLINVAQSASNVWSGGDLTINEYGQLDKVLDASGGGRDAAIDGCDNLIQALDTAYTAQSYLSGSAGLLPGATVSSQTYWFYNTGDNDPVQHQYWITTSEDVDDFTFETLVGPVPTRPRPSRPPRHGGTPGRRLVGGF